MNASDIDPIVGTKPVFVLLGDLLARADGPGRASWQDLPAVPGVYAVCLSNWKDRSFAADAGRARNAQPAELDLLRDKRHRILAAGPTDILYLGKAGARTSDLRKRVRQLVRFGVGRASNHRGGEWLWQLKGIEDAELRMWCCARGNSEPLERELLAQFRGDQGEWPIANRY